MELIIEEKPLNQHNLLRWPFYLYFYLYLIFTEFDSE